MKEKLLEALKKVGVFSAGTLDDSRRWSVSDLAKDLADVLEVDIADAERRAQAWRKAHYDLETERLKILDDRHHEQTHSPS